MNDLAQLSCRGRVRQQRIDHTLLLFRESAILDVPECLTNLDLSLVKNAVYCLMVRKGIRCVKCNGKVYCMD